MKSCTLIGIGMANPSALSEQAVTALQNAPLVAGAERMVQAVAPFVRGKTLCAYDVQKIAAAFNSFVDTDQALCAVFSGDTGFYSGAANLRSLLQADGWNVTTIPGISTPQYFASRLGENWQDWHLVSAHGTNPNLGISLSYAPKTFFLTGGTVTVRTIAQFLLDHDIEATMTVGSRLGVTAAGGRAIRTSACAPLPSATPSGGAPIPNANADEVIFSASPEEVLSRTDYDESLACVLVSRMVPDIPHGALCDDFFVRDTTSEEKPESGNHRLVPMTKRFVRAAILSLLSVRDGEVVWDIGAGTGAVSTDIARNAHCAVYAVEEKENACALIRANRKKAAVPNLSIIPGRAPEILSDLPAPDAVFVGGSEGSLEAILSAVYGKNPSARVVLSCVTVETLSQIQSVAAALKKETEVTQISVSQSKKAGSYHLMTAQNPVWLVSLG